jgi:hypothetical protein
MKILNSREPRNNDELSLFPELFLHADASAYYPRIPGYRVKGTSQEAAGRIAQHACKLRTEVLAEFVASVERGLTADQAAHALAQSVLAVRPRVSELACGGLLAATGERRRNQSGLFANVLRVTQAGLDEYRRGRP